MKPTGRPSCALSGRRAPGPAGAEDGRKPWGPLPGSLRAGALPVRLGGVRLRSPNKPGHAMSRTFRKFRRKSPNTRSTAIGARSARRRSSRRCRTPCPAAPWATREHCWASQRWRPFSTGWSEPAVIVRLVLIELAVGLLGKVFEAGVFVEPSEFDVAGRTVTLLRDENVALADDA